MPVFFWTGEEDYLISKKKEEWEKAFILKHGDINLLHLDGANLTYVDLDTHIKTLPFLGDKKLIFISDLPQKTNQTIKLDKIKETVDLLSSLDETVIVVFISSQPDKRSALYKQLVKIAKIEEFRSFMSSELYKWIENYVHSQGGKILPLAITFLIEYVGNDLRRITSELQKLLVYTNNEKSISEQDIKDLVVPSIELNVFHFFDALFTRNKKLSFEIMQKIVTDDISLMQFFALFIGQLRNLVLVKSLENSSKSNVMSSLRVAPFIASKLIKHQENFSILELKELYCKFVQIDFSIKTGKILISNNNEKALALEFEKLILAL